MIYYDRYCVEGCENKEISQRFLRAVLACSDAFSLIYFRYRTNEKYSEGVSRIKKRLDRFRLDSRDVTEWPGTRIISNEQGHSYRMVTYRVCMDILPILEEVDTLWDWDYPLFPMDPCFYKNGYAWFVVTAHEHWNMLYLERKVPCVPLASDLESLGVSLIPEKKVSASELYYHPYYLKKLNKLPQK